MKVTPNCCGEEDIRSRKQDTLISEADHEETMLTWSMCVCDFSIVCKIGREHINNEAHVGTEQRMKGGDPGETGLPQGSKQMVKLSITCRDDVPPLAHKDRPG